MNLVRRFLVVVKSCNESIYRLLIRKIEWRVLLEMEEACEFCQTMKCPMCKTKNAHVIVVNGRKKVVCYRAGCKFEMELPEKYQD